MATKWQHSRVLASMRAAFFARLPEASQARRTFGVLRNGFPSICFISKNVSNHSRTGTVQITRRML